MKGEENSPLNYRRRSIYQSVTRNDGEETESGVEDFVLRIKYRCCEKGFAVERQTGRIEIPRRLSAATWRAESQNGKDDCDVVQSVHGMFQLVSFCVSPSFLSPQPRSTSLQEMPNQEGRSQGLDDDDKVGHLGPPPPPPRAFCC